MTTTFLPIPCHRSIDLITVDPIVGEPLGVESKRATIRIASINRQGKETKLPTTITLLEQIDQQGVPTTCPTLLLAECAAAIARAINLTPQEWRQYLGDEPYRPTCPNLPVPEE